MTEKKIIKARDLFFQKQFTYYYDKWLRSQKKDGKRLDDEDFQNAVCKAYLKRMKEEGHKDIKECHLHVNSVRNWKKGRNYPTKYMPDIAKVLDIDVSLLTDPQDPEFNEALRNDYDKERFEFADKIGLDKNFMFIMLHLFSGSDFAFIKEYQYIDISPDEKEFTHSGSITLPEEIAKDIQCKFKGFSFKSEDIGIIKNYYTLPCKKDLLYMRMLQDKFFQFLKIEVRDLSNMLMNRKEIIEKLVQAEDWLLRAKDYQKKRNAQRKLEHDPPLPLWKCVDPVSGFGFVLDDDPEVNIYSEDFIRAQIKARGEDPDRID